MSLVFATNRPPAPGRPAGEVRSVIMQTLREAGPMAQRDLALQAQIGFRAVDNTMKTLVRSQAAMIVGYEKREHSRKWVALYDLPAEPSLEAAGRQGHGWVDLARCIQGWAR